MGKIFESTKPEEYYIGLISDLQATNEHLMKSRNKLLDALEAAASSLMTIQSLVVSDKDKS